MDSTTRQLLQVHTEVMKVSNHRTQLPDKFLKWEFLLRLSAVVHRLESPHRSSESFQLMD